MFGVDDNVKTLAHHSEFQNAWWQRPNSLYPYLISVDGNAAGFNLIASKKSFPQEIDADFGVHEFFILRTYRKTGVAENAAIDGFSRHKGKWEVVADPLNENTLAFWERIIRKYTDDRFLKEKRVHVWGSKTCFTFDNSI
ncbi:MAG: aminoglycoside 6'-N-acetyltransferase I [Saprospiraceae bacterium]